MLDSYIEILKGKKKLRTVLADGWKALPQIPVFSDIKYFLT